jgi:hypothetical protein
MITVRRLINGCLLGWLGALGISHAQGGQAANATTGADTFLSGITKTISQWKLPDSLQIHGFASQSYLHTTGNDFFGHSTNMGSLDFTEMGINGSWRPIEHLQTSMQIVYRRAGKTDDQDVRIDFGFLDYSFLADPDKTLGIRLGRVVNPYGLYSDTRDMPFTRPSILLPQGIYFDINRNLSFSSDGGQIYGEHRSRFGDFYLQVNGGYSRANDPDLKVSLAGDQPGNLDGRPSYMARLMYEWDSGRVRLGVTGAEGNAKFNPEGAQPILRGGTFTFSPLIFSAQYNSEFWSLTGEYAIRKSEISGFGPALPDRAWTGESYYIQGAYRFAEGWESYLRYDVVYLDRDDPNGTKYAATTGGPAYSQFAKDITAGVRWDVTPSIMLRAEYHRIKGTYWTSDLENQGNTSEYWDLFAVSAAYRF